MPRKIEKSLPLSLLEQLPRPLTQSFLTNEELEALAQEDQVEEEEPIDNDHLYSKKYLYLRKSTWAKWEQFCSMTPYDKETSWINYARDPDSAPTQQPFKSFLRWYIRQSRRQVLLLDEQEFGPGKGIATVSSIQSIWIHLTTEVDRTIMRSKRRSDPEHAKMWDLSYRKGQDRQPAHQIMKWIGDFQKGLANEFSLERKTAYTKKGATANDILLVLKALWECSNDIVCQPQARLAFHAAILLGGVTGARPGMLLRLKYSQFKLDLIRGAGGRPELVVTVQLSRNKIRVATGPGKHGESLAFAMTQVDCFPICLVSLVLARAIQDDAFEQGFGSIDDIFDRPSLSSVPCLALPFKPEWLNKEIFGLSSPQFYTLWHRVFDVAGFEEHPRPYALRVGAGSRLTAALPDSMRNYILGHTQAMYESNYQSHRVDRDLLGLAFNDKTAARKSELFEELRHMSLRRDRGAPLYISPEGQAQLDGRHDVTSLRRLLETSATEHREALQLKANDLMQQLQRLWLSRARKEYFAEAAALRQQGKEPADWSLSRGASGTAANVARLIADSMDADRVGDPREYGKALLAYLREPPYTSTRFGESVTPEHAPESSQDGEDGSKGQQGAHRTIVREWKETKNPSRCLICSRPFTERYNLTRHYWRTHVKEGLFTKPFSCPLCHEEVCGSLEWSSHVETVHGVQHTPQFNNWRTQQRPDNEHLVCPFLCQNLIKDYPSLITHINRYHIGRRACFIVSREQIYNWVAHARSTTIWGFTQSLLLCQDCGWLGTTDKGLICHMKKQHGKEASPTLDMSLKRARQESDDQEGALAERNAKRRIKDTAK